MKGRGSSHGRTWEERTAHKGPHTGPEQREGGAAAGRKAGRVLVWCLRGQVTGSLRTERWEAFGKSCAEMTH